MPGKSVEERLHAFERRIQQLQARREQLQSRLKQTERKQRTRRLIQVGAIMSHLGVETVEQAEALKRVVQGNTQLAVALRSVLATAIRERAASERLQ